MTEDFVIQHGENQFSFKEFKIENFEIDKDFTYNLLESEASQQLLLTGDYSEIFNSFEKLNNFEFSNLKIILYNLSFYSLESLKLENLIFDYFGGDKDIKVPISFNFKIEGSNYNAMNLGEQLGVASPYDWLGAGFFDFLVFEMGYEQLKFDFGTKWNWNTKDNNINLDLDLGIQDAVSIEFSTDIVDLDTNILSLQGAPLNTYLLTEPKLNKLDLSIIDETLMDKIIAYSAKESDMTISQHKDFLIQSMNLYSTTLGLDQNLYNELILALTNFINESEKISFVINPLTPVSINDLMPDILSQNYDNLNKKLKLSFKN